VEECLEATTFDGVRIGAGQEGYALDKVWVVSQVSKGFGDGGCEGCACRRIGSWDDDFEGLKEWRWID